MIIKLKTSLHLSFHWNSDLKATILKNFENASVGNFVKNVSYFVKSRNPQYLKEKIKHCILGGDIFGQIEVAYRKIPLIHPTPFITPPPPAYMLSKHVT